jgi:hypothetical protein
MSVYSSSFWTGIIILKKQYICANYLFFAKVYLYSTFRFLTFKTYYNLFLVYNIVFKSSDAYIWDGRILLLKYTQPVAIAQTDVLHNT